MKIRGKVTEQVVQEKFVEVEVADDADEDQIEQAVRGAAYKDGTGWEGVETIDVNVKWSNPDSLPLQNIE
jgi:hypothetical protein